MLFRSRHNNNEPESAIYYARIVSEHPFSERVGEAKQRLTAMNKPIPEPNPVALARAQQVPRDDRSMLGSMFGIFHHRPPVSTDTAAASNAAEEEIQTIAAPTSVRGGTSGSSAGSNEFNIDTKVVPSGKQQPVKKFR